MSNGAGKTITYRGFAYRQTPDQSGPWLVLFVAPAEELLTWAGIPRRTESAFMGFQRADDANRVSRAKQFFNMPPNQSPTALVVGIHPAEKDEQRIFLKLLETPSDKHAAVPCELIVNVPPHDLPLAAAVEIVRKQVSARLAGEPVRTEEEDAEAELDNEAAQSEEATEEDDDETPSEGIELTASIMHKLLEQLKDDAWVQANGESILDLARPATIIDGQHRVKGAAACERRLPFAVCAMIDCSWPEQVFQFTVVNYSSVGIPDQFITANAALSLTESELGALKTRLEQAQVKVIEYELMSFVQFDTESPFFNLINLSEGKDATKIGYKTMVRVARDWYQASAQALKHNLLPKIFPAIKGKGASRERLRTWQSDDHWGHFFIDFWKVIRDYYAPHKGNNDVSLWHVGGSNLMIAVVLHELQKSFFADLNGQDDEFFDVQTGEEPIAYLRSKLRQRASKFVTFFPPEFFATNWGIKSLNTSAGRTALRTALEKLRSSKGKYQYGKSALVTGETG